MARFKVRNTGATVDLNKDNFKAKGGEGSIHIIGDTVYKVCEPGKMIDIRKLVELHALDHPRIVRPEDILEDSKKSIVGYTMKLVPGNAVPLAQILTKTFREREGVTPAKMTELVKQIAEALRFIHKKPGYLQVDGNEFNYMVADTFSDVYMIDVNSFETPNFPADAIMPSIRDWHCPKDNATGRYKWSHLTDWYSFAIISWYMFTGIHPFKGRHPRFPDLKTAMVEQMKAGVSVLDPECHFPQAAVYFPFDTYIPGGASGAYMQWYKAVLAEGKRLPAPLDFQAVLVVAAKIKEIVGSNKFDIHELRDCVSQIVGFYEQGGREVIVTTDGMFVDNQSYPKLHGKFRVGFTTTSGMPVALVLEGDTARVFALETQTALPAPQQPVEFRSDNIMSYDGRLYSHYGSNIYEITFLEQPSGPIIPLQKQVATVLPQATQMFHGVVFQDMFGTRLASVFPEAGHHQQFKIEELAGLQITEAKYERGVLMVLTADKEGQANRFIFRLAKDFQSYDMRKVENITPIGLNFTVLPNGICICITEEEKVEIFPSRKDSPDLKSIADPAIKGNMRLCHAGSQVRVAHGDKLYSIAVKK